MTRIRKGNTFRHIVFRKLKKHYEILISETIYDHKSIIWCLVQNWAEWPNFGAVTRIQNRTHSVIWSLKRYIHIAVPSFGTQSTITKRLFYIYLKNEQSDQFLVPWPAFEMGTHFVILSLKSSNNGFFISYTISGHKSIISCLVDNWPE